MYFWNYIELIYAYCIFYLYKLNLIEKMKYSQKLTLKKYFGIL